MPFTDAAKNSMLDSLTPDAISLHTADPGATGTNEVAGGSYARGTPTFAAASAGSRALSTDVTMNVPAATTVTHVGVWELTTFLGSIDVTDEIYGADGTYKLLAASTALTIT